MQNEDEYEEFGRVRKNKDACLKFLVQISQSIERQWDSDPPQERLRRIKLLGSCLRELRDHKDQDLRELSRLGDKIKDDNILNLGLKHFLGTPSPPHQSGLELGCTLTHACDGNRPVSAHRTQVHEGA